MKKIIFMQLFCLLSFSIMAQPCTYKGVIDEMTWPYYKKYPSKKNIQKADFTSLILDQRTDYLGAIGVHRKRLVVLFSSAKRNPDNPLVYDVEGKTRVGKNVRQFKGTITLTQFISGKSDEASELDADGDEIQEEGVAVGNFTFDEYEDLPATGVFKGKVILWWFFTKKGKIKYNDGFDMADGYLNNAYVGTWTSKQTHKSQDVSWGHYRVPCSGDLDIGVGEFFPDRKYYKYGWDEYVKELKEKYPDSYDDE